MQQKKMLGPARAASTEERNRKPEFPSPASIRQRYGTGWPGYETAKAAWLTANPAADNNQIEQAMRWIAQAMRV